MLYYSASLGADIVSVNTIAFQPSSFNNLTIPGVGSQSIIDVRTSDGLVLTQYTISVVLKQKNNLAALQSLEFGYEVDLTISPPFEPTLYSYVIPVPPCMARYASDTFICSVDILATAGYGGRVSTPVNTPLMLRNADIGNPAQVTITLTAEDGVSTAIYTLNFMLQSGTYSYLNDISFTNGELTGVFDRGVNIYQANFNHTQTQAILMLGTLAGTVVTVNQQAYIPGMVLALADDFCTRLNVNITVQPEDTNLPPSFYQVQVVKLTAPVPPGPNAGLPDRIHLDILQVFFTSSKNETIVVDMRMQIAIALNIPASTEIVVLDVSNPPLGQMSARFGFFAPPCDAIDYGINWVQAFQEEFISGPTHGDLSTMPLIGEVSEINYYYDYSLDVCTVGGQVNWGATCIELQDSSIKTNSNGLAYEEAVSIVVAIAILILILVFLGDLLYRKIHRHQQQQQQGTELSNRGGSGRGQRITEKPEPINAGDSSPTVESDVINSPTESRPAADSEVVDVA